MDSELGLQHDNLGQIEDPGLNGVKASIKESRYFSAALAAFVVFLWATSWVLIKIGLAEIPSLTFAGLRYFISFLALLAVMLVSGEIVRLKDLSGRQYRKLIGLGLLLYAATQGAQFVALDFMPAVTVNLLWSFSPVAVALLGTLLLEETPTTLQLGGILLAVLGAVIFFYPARFPSGYSIGILVSVFGVLANAGAAVLGRDINRTRRQSPLLVTVVSMGIGSVVLLATGAIVQGVPSISGQGWLIILWLAIVNGALAFTLWNLTLQSLSATESSVINGTMIIWIPILAVIFLGESLTLQGIIGLAVVGAGTVLVQLKYPDTIRRLLVWVQS